MNTAETNGLIAVIQTLVSDRDDLRAMAVCGSWARGNPRPDSDLDALIIAQDPGSLRRHQEWMSRVGAGYVKITNTGQEPDRLIGGSVSLATEVAVHEMAMRGGIAKMRRLEGGLEIGPGQTEELKPGGYHLMFMGLRQGLREGETTNGTLVFEKAGTVGVEYHVMRIGPQ